MFVESILKNNHGKAPPEFPIAAEFSFIGIGILRGKKRHIIRRYSQVFCRFDGPAEIKPVQIGPIAYTLFLDHGKHIKIRPLRPAAPKNIEGLVGELAGRIVPDKYSSSGISE
jgi:hypothetical protein